MLSCDLQALTRGSVENEHSYYLLKWHPNKFCHFQPFLSLSDDVFFCELQFWMSIHSNLKVIV